MTDIREINTPKERPIRSNEIIAAQVASINDTLKRLSLPLVKVEPPQERDVSYWDNRGTLGILGLVPESVAMLVSAEQPFRKKEMPIDTILITPGSTAGSLKKGHSTAQPFADFFFAVEDGKVIPIIPSKPVPIDLVLPSNSLYNHHSLHPDNVIFDQMTHDITCYKLNGKPVMINYGIPTPRGFLADQGTDVDSYFARLTALSDLDGLVVKDPTAHKSKGVWLFGNREDEIDAAREKIREVLEQTGCVLVEEKITPIDVYFSPHQNLDWNIRSICLFEGKEIHFLGGLIRYNQSENKPVSISSGAYTLPLVEGSWLTDFTEDFSIQCGHQFRAAITKEGGKPQGIFALDIMLTVKNNKVKALVLEPNGWLIGGFEELCQTTGQTLKNIKDRFVPALAPRLKRNHQNRNTSEEYDQIPIPVQEIGSIVNGFCSLGQFDKALKIVHMYQDTLREENNLESFLAVIQQGEERVK